MEDEMHTRGGLLGENVRHVDYYADVCCTDTCGRELAVPNPNDVGVGSSKYHGERANGRQREPSRRYEIVER